jgi:hypothetical protein
VTVNERNTTLDLKEFAALAARHPVPFAGMGKAKHRDAGIALQHLAAAAGLVTLANEISLCHCFKSLCVDDLSGSPVHPPSRKLRLLRSENGGMAKCGAQV